MAAIKNHFYVAGGDDVLVPLHLNFGKFMLHKLRLGGDKEALHNITTGEKFTYKELTQKAVDLSVGFIKLGMKKGDVVILAEDTITYIPTALAVIFTGATLFPLRLNVGRANLRQRLTNFSPTYIICNERFWNKFGDILSEVKSCKAIITSEKFLKDAIHVESFFSSHNDVDEFEPAECQGQEDVAVIYHSSGTSGIPKAVQLTHVNCILHCLADEYKHFYTGYSAKYWSENYLDFKIYKFLAYGKKILHSVESSAETLLNAVEKYQIDIVFVTPDLIYDLVNLNRVEKYNLSSLKVIHSRSAPLQAKTIERIKEIFPSNVKVVQAYGMTECGELASEIRVLCGPKGLKIGSVGIPSRGLTLKVVNPHTGENVSENTNGEICVKGAALMKGYVGVDPATYLDKEGFFKTGDWGYFDEDGYFYVTDRLKDIMIVDACNVAPTFLETMLQLHPGIKEAGVVGKPHPKLNDLPTAFIVKLPGSKVTEQEIIDYVKAEMSVEMQLLGGVYFIPELPRNDRGKIVRRQLKEMLDHV